jgi:hypothetical protein
MAAQPHRSPPEPSDWDPRHLSTEALVGCLQPVIRQLVEGHYLRLKEQGQLTRKAWTQAASLIDPEYHHGGAAKDCTPTARGGLLIVRQAGRRAIAHCAIHNDDGDPAAATLWVELSIKGRQPSPLTAKIVGVFPVLVTPAI